MIDLPAINTAVFISMASWVNDYPRMDWIYKSYDKAIKYYYVGAYYKGMDKRYGKGRNSQYLFTIPLFNNMVVSQSYLWFRTWVQLTLIDDEILVDEDNYDLLEREPVEDSNNDDNDNINNNNFNDLGTKNNSVKRSSSSSKKTRKRFHTALTTSSSTSTTHYTTINEVPIEDSDIYTTLDYHEHVEEDDDDENDDNDNDNDNTVAIKNKANNYSYTSPTFTPAKLLDDNNNITKIFDGKEKGKSNLEKFIDMSPGKIVDYLFGPALMELCISSHELNDNDEIQIGNLYIFFSVIIFMQLVPLSKLVSFWQTNRLVTPKIKYQNKMSLATFRYIRNNIKGYKEIDLENPRKDKKIFRIVDKIQERFISIMEAPSQHISIDEAMGGCSVKRNPVFTSLGNAKPLEGFRFFVMVDYNSKVAINFLLDNKLETSASCKNTPGGFSGKMVQNLIDTANLPGMNYILYLDNYYSSMPLAESLLTQDIQIIGTMKKSRGVSELIKFKGKNPRPTINTPRGSLNIVKTDKKIYQYGWMDTSAVYFIDTAYGCTNECDITRHDADYNNITFKVPYAITKYNQNMGGVDIYDQIRSKIHVDQAFRATKWTERLIEILFSFCLTNGYNIYRNLYPNRLDRTDFLTEVMYYFLNHPLTKTQVNLRCRGESSALDDHDPIQFEHGTEGGATGGNRRLRLICIYANCPFVPRKRTSYYCNICEVPLHPYCSKHFHDEKLHETCHKHAGVTACINRK